MVHADLFSLRRAQLRDCLEVLRQHVPLPDKLTTLALLQSAKKYIEVSQVQHPMAMGRVSGSLSKQNAIADLQSLQQKEREENEIKMKLEHEHSVLISKLVELGAAGFINSSTSRSSPPPPGTTPTEIAAPNEGIPLSLAEDLTQISPSPKNSAPQKGWEEIEMPNVVEPGCDELWIFQNSAIHLFGRSSV